MVWAAAKEARSDESKKRKQPHQQKAFKKQPPGPGHKQQPDRSREQSPRDKQRTATRDVSRNGEQETTSPVKKDADGFAVPFLPTPSSPSSTQSPLKRPAPSSDQQGTDQSKRTIMPPPGYRGPPPGYAEKESRGDPPPVKKRRVEEEGPGSDEPTSYHHNDPAQNAKTVFISNLDFKKKEADLYNLLSRAGKVKDIRLVKAAKGRSKGFGYVEYEDELAAAEALKLDRTELDGRAMYVSKCVDKGDKRAQFKYDTELNKRKLFVRGLPFSTNKEALHTLFTQYGTVTEVRMVTYKSGQPKGLAYIEYEQEEDAAKAVMQTDGITMGEHQINVSISNPPKRRSPMEQRGLQADRKSTTFTPTLGGGKKDVNRAEKPRTLLAFQPRALKSKSQPKAPAKDADSGAAKKSNEDPAGTPAKMESESSGGESAKGGENPTDGQKKGLSNAQFRDLLLAKKNTDDSVK